jgi:hypothetical protein
MPYNIINNSEPLIAEIAKLKESYPEMSVSIDNLINADKSLGIIFNDLISVYSDPALTESIDNLNKSLFMLQKKLIQHNSTKLLEIIQSLKNDKNIYLGQIIELIKRLDDKTREMSKIIDNKTTNNIIYPLPISKEEIQYNQYIADNTLSQISNNKIVPTVIPPIKTPDFTTPIPTIKDSSVIPSTNSLSIPSTLTSNIVDVFIKMKLVKDNPNNYISINNNIILITDQNVTQQIDKNCFNYIIPSEYTPDNNNSYIIPDRNIELYSQISPVFETLKNGANILISNNGFSGSGKTYTLIGNDNNGIIPTFYAQYQKEYNIKIYVYEQYGHLSVDPMANPSTIFTKQVFNEYTYAYIVDQSRNIVHYNESIAFDKNGTPLFKFKPTNLFESGKSLVSILDAIYNYRKQHKFIKPTLHNKDSARSHLYLHFECTHKISGKIGSLIIADMAGQENSHDVLMSYMDNNIDVFNAYFNYLYGNAVSVFNNKMYTDISSISTEYINNISGKIFKDAIDLFIGGICTEHDLYDNCTKLTLNSVTALKLLKPGALHILRQYKNSLPAPYTQYKIDKYPPINLYTAWFKFSFLYPVELFLLIKLSSDSNINKRSLDSMLTTHPDLKELNDKLIKNPNGSYENLVSNIFLSQTRTNREPIKTLLFSIYDCMVKFNKLLQQMYGKDIINNPDIVDDLIQSFLEGFYINESNASKIRYFRDIQKIGNNIKKYFPITTDKYSPFTSYGFNSNVTSEYMTYNLLNMFKLTKVIEIATIRGDKYNGTNPYKYAKASCSTLKEAALISGKQCNVDNLCVKSKQQTGGYNAYLKYIKYKNKYLTVSNTI